MTPATCLCHAELMRLGPSATLLLKRSLFTIAACGFVACGGGSSSWPASGAPTPAPAPSPAPAPAPAAAPDVLTWHNDAARTGQYLAETTLTPANVNSTRFGLAAMWPVDGRVDAQPLFASAVTLADGSVHDLVVAATEHDSIYAFDAHNGAVLWHKSMLGAGETTSDARNCGQVSPEIGVTATPAIDRSLGTRGALFLTAVS